MKVTAAALMLLAACACAAAKLDVIQVGPWFQPRDWRKVEVFTSRDQTARPWGGIAIIHSPRVKASGSEAALERMKLQARRQAAELGADAVIISVDSASAGPEMGVYEEPELFVSALAIKYVTEVSTPAAK
ncbi:MAG: hypothetical protein M0025_11210 [Elusimicrobia bacterium]|nr:hypothetical protein [Elusimicrobiota bacterium]